MHQPRTPPSRGRGSVADEARWHGPSALGLNQDNKKTLTHPMVSLASVVRMAKIKYSYMMGIL